MQISYKTRMTLKHLVLVTMFACAFLAEQAYADRVKDLASVAGVRNNQLIGSISSGRMIPDSRINSAFRRQPWR